MPVQSLESALEHRKVHLEEDQVDALRQKISRFYSGKSIVMMGPNEQNAKEFLDGLIDDFGIKGEYADRTVPISIENYLVILPDYIDRRRGAYSSLKGQFGNRIIQVDGNDYFAVCQALSLYIDGHKTQSRVA